MKFLTTVLWYTPSLPILSEVHPVFPHWSLKCCAAAQSRRDEYVPSASEMLLRVWAGYPDTSPRKQDSRKSLISHALRHFHIFRAEFSLWRSVVFRHFRSGYGLKQGFHILHFFSEGGFIGNLRHIQMMVCMVADRMPVLHHSFYDFRRRL